MKISSSWQTLIIVGAMVSPGAPPVLGTGENQKEEKPMALRKIMQELGRNMQVITDGISREDWKLVAETAPLIADHPQPPWREKVRILSFIGTEARTFKGHDQKTHEAAQVMREAAVQKDGAAVIAAFAKVQTSCLACHETFREPFLKHFYGTEQR